MLEVDQNSEVVLYRFNKLLREMLRGEIKRNSFRPWEIELLLDIESCNLTGAKRRETLRRYQRAVQRQMENGAPAPVTLTEYLANCRARRKKRAESCPV